MTDRQTDLRERRSLEYACRAFDAALQCVKLHVNSIYYLRTDIVFGAICRSVCLCVCVSAQNLENYWTEIAVTR